MRWDRLFEDLEDQLASEWEAERAALDTEAERLRLSKLSLRERLRALVGTEPTVSVDLVDGTVATGTVSAVGADWFAVIADTRRGGALLLPFAGTAAIGVPQADLLRSARPVAAPARLADRMTLGFVLRDLSRRRIPVTVGLAGGRLLSGTIDRAGADPEAVIAQMHKRLSPDILDMRTYQAGSSRPTPWSGCDWTLPQRWREGSVGPLHHASAPQLGEARGVGLTPQRHAAGLLGLVVEVALHAVALDPPARGGADLHAAEPSVEHEGHHFIDRHAEQFGDLRGGEQARIWRGCAGHPPIIRCGAGADPPRAGLWINTAVGAVVGPPWCP